MVRAVVINLKSPTGSCPKETAASAALFGPTWGPSLYARATLRLRAGKVGLVYASRRESCAATVTVPRTGKRPVNPSRLAGNPPIEKPSVNVSPKV